MNLPDFMIDVILIQTHVSITVGFETEAYFVSRILNQK